ncbi:MAG: LUD domain-containing protein [Nitrososphaerota archaeon]
MQRVYILYIVMAAWLKGEAPRASATRGIDSAAKNLGYEFLEKCRKNGFKTAYVERPEALASVFSEWAAHWSIKSLMIAGLSGFLKETIFNALISVKKEITCLELPDLPSDLTLFRASSLGVFRVYAGVAETGGLIVLDDWGSNLASLIPEYTVGLLEAGEVVSDYWALTSVLRQRDIGGMVIISGPSSTSDIELTHVIGVHGPVEAGVIVTGFELDE